jgi:predicted transposase YbfD/YdcC
VVIRRLWLDTAAAGYARETLAFPGLRVLLRVDREVRDRRGVRSSETRYFASSLDAGRVAPSRFLQLVRGHWLVENSLHYVKDRWWDEDRHSCRRPGLARAFTTMMTAAQSVLRATSPEGPEGPVKPRADELAWDPRAAIRLITDSFW